MEGRLEVHLRLMGFALERKSGRTEIVNRWKKVVRPALNQTEAMVASDDGTVLPNRGIGAMLCHRTRYFTDGDAIGTIGFVNEIFAKAKANGRFETALSGWMTGNRLAWQV